MSEAILIKKDKKTTEKSVEDDGDEYEETKNDFPTMIKDFLAGIPWRLSIYMFILLIVLFSKQFAENVLESINENWVDGNVPTNTGTIILCILAALGLIVIDLLIRSKLL